jgi:hypothetical protein
MSTLTSGSTGRRAIDRRTATALVVALAAGLASGLPFGLMRQRRLEILIVIPFLIDAGMVVAR